MIDPLLINTPYHTKKTFDMDSFPQIVDWCARIVRVQQYEAIAACGHSGLTVAGAVSYLVKVPVIAVRKEGDTPLADSRKVSAVLPDRALRYAFIDDCISAGRTLKNVVAAIERELGDKFALTAVLLYGQSQYDTENVLKYMGFPSVRAFGLRESLLKSGLTL